MADQPEVTVHCPKCDGQDIRQRSEAYALLEVYEWELQDGVPVAIDVDGSVDADWEPVDRGAQFECLGCDWRGDANDLKVTASEPK